MTERDRLAAEMRRLEWLADAQLGPARVHRGPVRIPAMQTSSALPLGLWRRGIAAALVLGRRVRMLRPGFVAPRRATADASGR